MPPAVPTFKFATTDGVQLCRKIAKDKLELDPHDYVVEGACRALDGMDLLAITPTGSGKTSFMIVYLAVMCALLEDPALRPPGLKSYPRNPAMIVVCPTKSLELDMEPKFAKAGLAPLVINSDTVDVARRSEPPQNLWKRAADVAVRVVLLSPEQLRTKGYAGLMEDESFQARIVALAVDEAHLMDTWGNPSFRPAFKQIGHARARLAARTITFALTATLRVGKPTRAVCAFLGLQDGKYHLIRRSNIRPDIDLIFRTVTSGARAMTFPELDWVLDGERRVIIFCRTIAVGFRVAVYLWNRAVNLPDRDRRIRLYNALNASSYNCATLKLLHEDPRSRVTIATDTLAVGIDAANTDDVVLYDHELPGNTDMILQKIGRIRDGTDRGARGIVYLPRNAEEQARKLLETSSGPPPSKRPKTASRSTSGGASQKHEPEVDDSTARLILAPCKVAEIDRLYANPDADTPCGCEGCCQRPRPKKPDPCRCSGCSPEPSTSTPNASVPAPSVPASHAVPPVTTATERGRNQNVQETAPNGRKREHITKKMRAYAKEKLTELRFSIWWNGDPLETELYPSEEFLPDLLMDVILDDLHVILDVDALRTTLMDYVRLRDHWATILDALNILWEDFVNMRAEARAAALEKRRKTLAARKEAQANASQRSGDGEMTSAAFEGGAVSEGDQSTGTRSGVDAWDDEDEDEMYWLEEDSEWEGLESEDDAPVDIARVQPHPSGLTIKIPGRRALEGGNGEGCKHEIRVSEGESSGPSAGKIKIPGGRMRGSVDKDTVGQGISQPESG